MFNTKQNKEVNIMVQQVSQENLEKLGERHAFLSAVIRDQSRRMAHPNGLQKEFGAGVILQAIQNLTIEKLAIELQMDTLERLLKE